MSARILDPSTSDASSEALARLAAPFQTFASSLAQPLLLRELRISVGRLIDSTPLPLTYLERRMLSILFLEASVQLWTALHDGVIAVCRCPQLRITDLHRLLHADARASFRAWSDALVTRFVREHRVCGACAAARLIQEHPTTQWTVRSLAWRVGVPPGQLSRRFSLEFGMHVHDYIRLIRVCVALPALADTNTKIEAVAYEVGYRSKKDFYVAIDKWVHMTPAMLRNTPRATLDALLSDLRSRQRGTCRDADSFRAHFDRSA